MQEKSIWVKKNNSFESHTKLTKVVMSVFWGVKSPIRRIKALMDFFFSGYKWIDLGQARANRCKVGNKLLLLVTEMGS